MLASRAQPPKPGKPNLIKPTSLHRHSPEVVKRTRVVRRGPRWGEEWLKYSRERLSSLISKLQISKPKPKELSDALQVQISLQSFSSVLISNPLKLASLFTWIFNSAHMSVHGDFPDLILAKLWRNLVLALELLFAK